MSATSTSLNLDKFTYLLTMLHFLRPGEMKIFLRKNKISCLEAQVKLRKLQ